MVARVPRFTTRLWARCSVRCALHMVSTARLPRLGPRRLYACRTTPEMLRVSRGVRKTLVGLDECALQSQVCLAESGFCPPWCPSTPERSPRAHTHGAGLACGRACGATSCASPNGELFGEPSKGECVAHKVNNLCENYSAHNMHPTIRRLAQHP